MSTEAPYLSLDDLRAELAQFHSQRHRKDPRGGTFITAFFGRGELAHVEVSLKDGPRTFDVVPVHCELEIRQALVDAESKRRDVALLVDSDERLPLDILGRLAGGRIQYISPERRLGNLFGVQRVSPTLVDNPLANALLRASWNFPAARAATTIDLTTAWRSFLSRTIGLPTEETLTEDGVVDFLAFRPVAAADPLLDKLLAEIPGLAPALEDFWANAAGPIASLCWRNWRTGNAPDVAAMAFVLDALVASKNEGAVKVFVSLRLREFGEVKGVAPEALVERWARLAPGLKLRLGDRATSVLKRADALVAEPALHDVLRSSRYLTAGFEGLKASLAAVLEGAVAGVKNDGEGTVPRAAIAKAAEIYNQLAGHHLAGLAENAASLARTMMGLRLLAYLSVRPNWAIELKDSPPTETMFRLAESFACEGGFVDRARGLVRGGDTSDALDAAIGHVADAADAYRDQMDRGFGKALVPWNETRRSGRVLPIENALGDLAVSFLKEGDRRRLLILLMDGMSWATAAEIILDIRDLGYSPLRWQPPKALRPGLPAPMIAALPTMTEVSRSALFAGRLLQPGEQLSTVRDPERLRENKAFVKAFGDGPTLLLRTEAESLTGELTGTARRLVESSERVVSVVVNAVDDQLTGKPGYQVAANRTTIKALEPLLTLSRDAGRAVLLIADHGHVTSARPHTSVSAGKTENPRFRELDEGAPTNDHEVVFSGPNAYVSRKSKRLAALFAETDRYVSQRHVGEHGGASLAEVVTPVLMIGSQDLSAIAGEEGEALDVVAYPVPAWWHLSVPVEKQPLVPAQEKMPAKGAKTKTPVATSQLVLPSVAPEPVPPPVVPVATISKWAMRLGEVFADLEKPRKQELTKRVIPAVELLVEYNGRVAEDVFAGRLGEALRNVGGRVALMAEFLNEDGYQVVVHDVNGKQVRLDMDLLNQFFGG